MWWFLWVGALGPLGRFLGAFLRLFRALPSFWAFSSAPFPGSVLLLGLFLLLPSVLCRCRPLLGLLCPSVLFLLFLLFCGRAFGLFWSLAVLSCWLSFSCLPFWSAEACRGCPSVRSSFLPLPLACACLFFVCVLAFCPVFPGSPCPSLSRSAKAGAPFDPSVRTERKKKKNVPRPASAAPARQHQPHLFGVPHLPGS